MLLTKLDLGKNKIARVEGLETLSQLTQLSLEDNEVTSLAGLGKVTSLMELYIGNNRIAQARSRRISRRHTAREPAKKSTDAMRPHPMPHAAPRRAPILTLQCRHAPQVKEVQQLKGLPKLIILDLSGRPLCEQTLLIND